MTDARLVPDHEQPGCWFVRVDGTDQSYIDPADPTHLEFDYVQRIASIIDTTWLGGQRIATLHIGGAGMTLPRYIAHTRPTSAQIVFEPDETLTEAVRATAPLPRNSGIKVRPQEGRDGLAHMRAAWADLVIQDAFLDASVPASLSTIEWFSLVRGVLKPEGTFIANLTDHGTLQYSKTVASALIRLFETVLVVAESSTLKGRRFGNVVMAAGGGLDVHAVGRQAAGAAFPYRVLSDWELDRWIGRIEPFTDATAEGSPPPPDGPTVFR